MRRSVVQELGIVLAEFADLVAHRGHNRDFIIVQDSKVPLHALDGARNIEIETQFVYDLVLKLHEVAD